MAWSFKKAVEKVTRWNAAEVNNLQEGVQESKEAAATAQVTAVGKPSKAEVETLASEAARKSESEAAEAVAVVNIASLSGIPAAASTDEVTLTAGQNVLLTAQTTGSQDGLWIVESGAWKRPPSFLSGSSQFGVFVPVVLGKVYSGSVWVLKNKTAVTVETTAQEWEVNSAGSGVVASKELVAVLGKETTGAGEGALENLRTLSFAEQSVHRGNTAIGWNAMQAFTGLLGTFVPSSTTAIGSSVLNLTGAKASGFVNSATPKVVFRKLTSGVTGLAIGVSYYIVGEATNSFELAASSGGTGIKVAGHALEVASTEIALLASAEDNTCIGAQAGNQLSTGGGNALIGEHAGYNLTSGEENVAIGCEALSSQKTTTGNVAIGFRTLNQSTAIVGLAIGWKALELNTTGQRNLAVGYRALEANTTAERNLAVGHEALEANKTGHHNCAIGHESLEACTSGIRNTMVGILAGKAVTTSEENTGIGYLVLGKLTEKGEGNTAVGVEAGAKLTGKSSKNVCIGIRSGPSAEGEASNELWIANNETTAWVRGAESGKKLSFCGKTPIEPHAAAHTETTKALWEHLEALGLA